MVRYQPQNSLKSPRFSGIKTFMRLPHVQTTEDVDFVIVGLPFDSCASYRPGSRFGPLPFGKCHAWQRNRTTPNWKLVFSITVPV